MTRLARWCFTRRRTVLAAWLLLLIVALGAARAAGGAFNSSLSLPGTDSQAAVSVLTQHYPAAAGETDQVVIQATGGATVRSPQVRGPVTRALARVSAVPGIASVTSPYAAAGAAQVSRGGTIAFARVTWDRQPDQVTAADAGALIAAAESADGPGVHVSLGGASITNSERAKPGPSVAVGVIAALAVLLVVFGGAFLAALTPLAGAALALVIGSSAITLLSHGLTVASASTDLAVLIGLGVGVDYGLFLVNTLRGTLIPQAEHGSDLVAHVGGQTATAIDFAHVLGSKLPLFVAVVVILAFILLAAVFRSLLIPLTASALNLISVVAALGAITAVFTRGRGAALLGLSGTGPVDAFLPVVMFSVLFGLSMDYEVYTVSRMQEEWRLLRSRPEGSAWRNHAAVTAGQAHSTRIVTAASGPGETIRSSSKHRSFLVPWRLILEHLRT
jgi:putative drug exporter of the RND superfamily